MATQIIYPALENYQRDWRQYSVDKNLKDGWLVRLNNLSLFDVVNVCEGHFTCDDTYPVVVMFAKDAVIEKLADFVCNAQEELSKLLTSYFDAESDFKFTYYTGISNSSSDQFNRSRVKFSVSSNNPRLSFEFDDVTADWFENTVALIEKTDEILADRIFLHRDRPGENGKSKGSGFCHDI